MNKQELEGLLIGKQDELLRVACNLTHQDTDKAWDLVQSTYEKAIKAHDSFDGANLMGWLVTILRNTFRNNYRDAQKIAFNSIEDYLETGVDLESALESAVSGSDDTDEGSTAFGTASAEDIVLGNELSAELAEALTLLSPKQLEVINLVWLEGFTYQETAEALGIAIGTVMSTIARSRAILRSAL